MNEILKKNVKRICKKWKMTQEEMSVAFGLSENAIANMMAERRGFEAKLLEGLAQMCHVTVNELETTELETIPERITMKVAEPKPGVNDEVVKLYKELIASKDSQIASKDSELATVREMVEMLKSQLKKQ